MKQLIIIILTALIAWVTSTFAWWMIAVVPFLVSVFLKLKSGKGFLNGFCAIAVLWLYLILKTDIANEHILSTKIAALFTLPHTAFIIVNTFIGALVGGLGGWSGAAMRKIYKSNN